MTKFMSMLIKWYHWYKIHVRFAEALYTQLQNRHSVCVVICLKCTLKTTRRYSTNWKLNTLAESNKTQQATLNEQLIQFIHLQYIHTCISRHQTSSNVFTITSQIQMTSWSEKKEKCTQEKQLMCGLLINIMTIWLTLLEADNDSHATQNDNWHVIKNLLRDRNQITCVVTWFQAKAAALKHQRLNMQQ